MFSAFQKISQALQGISASLNDAYFNLVTLLLNTTSTNGAQNNTFLDSSSNNFSITRNGNPTQGTFTPFSQAPGYWSTNFPGSSNITWTGTAIGSGDFTVECWFNATAYATYTTIIGALSGGTNALALYVNSDTQIQVDFINVGNVTFTVPSMALGAWHHLAVTRASGSLTVFVDGVRSSTGAVSNTNNYSTNSVSIGYSSGAVYFPGNLSNLRIVKGSAVYSPSSSTITVPTAPLTAITNTQLLTCQSNQFVDNSTNAFTLTPSGTPSIQAFSPFLPTAAYSTSVVGGGYYGDGSGDGIYFQDTTQSGTSSSFNLGASNNASVDHWWYPTAAQATAGFSKQVSAPTDWNGQIWYQVNLYDSGTISFFYRGGANFQYIASALPSNFLNQWNHVAIASDTSNNLSVFFNGVRVATTVATIGLASTTPNYITFGQQAAGQTASSLKGYMSGLRFIQGSGAYNAASTTITVPTAPPTSTGTTQLLLSCTNAGIYDSAAKNVMETVSSVQVSTTQSKFPPTSIWFQAGGTLAMANNPGLQFGTGDFTVEFFVYWNTVPTASVGFVSGSGNGSTDIRFTGTLLYLGKFNQSLDSSFAWTPSTGQWYHVAMTRNGSSVRAFVNGSQIGSTATNSNTYNCVGTSFYVGTTTFGASGDTPLAYIQQFRITKGFSRYNANFTPPSSAFPVQ